MRLDTMNVNVSNKMYSAIGKATTGGLNEVVQNGYFGKVGALLEEDIYEFLPLADGDRDIFVMATPEVDADESKISNNTLTGFTMVEGQVGDIVQLKTHDKIAVEEKGIESLAGSGVVGKYVYVKSGKRKLQYKATLPDAVTDKALLIGVIESVVPATQRGTYVSSTLANVALNYNIVRIRFI